MIRASPCQLTHSPKTTESSCNPSHPRRYRQEIDGLRAIAVIAVILNHLHEAWLPGGFLGVDVFFVISGYVITASIEERADTPLIPFLSAFYRRRIQRLAPALICCIAITGVLTCLLVNTPETSLITGATAVAPVISDVSGVLTNRQVSTPVIAMQQIRAGASRWMRRR